MQPIAPYLEHTALEQGLPIDALEQVAREAVAQGFATCCVRAERIPWVIDTLKGSAVHPCAAVGYRLLTEKLSRERFKSEQVLPCFDITLAEREQEIADVFGALLHREFSGTVEFDICLNLCDYLRGQAAKAKEEMEALIEFGREKSRQAGIDVVLKLTLEHYLLTEEHKHELWQWATELGADYIKTSTGYAPVGATVEDIRAMQQVLGGRVKIKAAGGVTQYNYQGFLQAGADRLGTSRAMAIVEVASE